MLTVGIDFDNTIVSYDAVFHKTALEKGLIPGELPVTKEKVRNYLRQSGLEQEWIKLQGCVYGKKMLEAKPFPGVLDFFKMSKNLDIDIRIISHRTLRPFLGPEYDLHQAAKEWIEYNNFYEQTGLSKKKVFFEFTRDEKIERIKLEKCEIFIDDLPEFILSPKFPVNVKSILFDPENQYSGDKTLARINSWNQIQEIISR